MDEKSRSDVPQDHGKAVELLQQAATQGQAYAQFCLGVLYADGTGGLPQDDGKAVALFSQAAAQGQTNAQYRLGLIYEHGRRGLRQDELKGEVLQNSRRELLRATLLQKVVIGYLCALFIPYGILGSDGIPPPNDWGSSIGLILFLIVIVFSLSVTENEASLIPMLSFFVFGAFYAGAITLAKHYSVEEIVWEFIFYFPLLFLIAWLAPLTPLCDVFKDRCNDVKGHRSLLKDPGKAAELFAQAAAQGQVHAQYRLGLMYEKGHRSLPKNDEKAVELFAQAAAQGQMNAQYRLGIMYEKGRGGLAKNDEKAVELLMQAATQGQANAQYRLGFMYEKGRGGLPQDDAKAIEFYQEAAAQNQSYARYRLGLISRAAFLKKGVGASLCGFFVMGLLLRVNGNVSWYQLE